MPDEADISDLIERAKSGDEAARREILSRFGEEVHIMVRGRLPKSLRPRFDSIDFTQSVWGAFFAQLQKRSREFASPQHVLGFLKGVARNKINQQHRKRTRTQKEKLAREEPLFFWDDGREVEREIASPEPTPSKAFQASERLDQLTAGCTPMEIKVITLRHAGMTFVEIAKRTGIHERSARRIIDDARERMEARG